ncbi:replicative DNA helicase [Candidatus Uhrbacteria bacterium]|nr:replicative DNA helicase [Candidatus Uhrbacteria bacterium]
MAGIDRVPPHNLEAEASLLGSLLIDQQAAIKIADRLSAEDFYRPAHATVYEAMMYLFARHEPIDVLSVGNRLEEMSKLEEIGGRSGLAEISNTVPTAAHVGHYADIVKKKAVLRRLISAANDISALGYHEEQEIEQLLDQAEQRLFGVSQRMLKQNFVPLTDILAQAFERIDELHRERGKLRGLPTGFSELDSILAGLQKSDMVVLAARPSVGKTSLALDVVRNVAIKTKLPVAVFSLEMSKEQLVDRMICTEANVDLWKMRTGRLSERDDDFPRIGHALGVLSEAPIFIDDSAGANIMEIRTKCRRLQSEKGLGLVVIDYLQLMEAPGGSTNDSNRTQEVSQMSRGLKQLARELNVPVVVLSQLNRAVELSKPAIPKLAHLRESGSIEQDADVVLFIYRKSADPNFRNEELPLEERSSAEIYIAKHRNGPVGMVRLAFDPQRVCFRSMDRRHPSAQPSVSQKPSMPLIEPPPLETIEIPPPPEPSSDVSSDET